MVILVEQNVKAALKVADRAYVMDKGEIILEGKANELTADPMIQSTYLGLEKSVEVQPPDQGGTSAPVQAG